MKLDYNILWFEDDAEWFAVANSRIEDFLNDLGFKLKTTNRDRGDDLDSLLTKINNRQVDVNLILIDFKLAGSENGKQLIDKIRNQDLLSEIVFYSQSADVRAQVENPEGAFFSKRDDLVDKAKSVIGLTIKKAQDINNVRGLVIAETSEIERRLLNNVQKMTERGDSAKVRTKKNELHAKVLDNRKDRLDEFARLNPEANHDKVCISLDHGEKLSAVNRLIKAELKEGANQLFTEHKESLTKYREEVIEIRNILAHVEESIDPETGRKALKSLAPGAGQVILTEEKCIQIRKNLMKHAESLEAFHKTL